MLLLRLVSLAAAVAGASIGSAPLDGEGSLDARQQHEFVGYLVSTFSDANPEVQWHLSDRQSPSSFRFLNQGDSILASTVGMRGVRDIYFTTNTARSEYIIIATDLDINAPGFNWDWATRHGSRGLVVWRSNNLVDWSEPELVTVETETAGMAWAPSAVWDVDTQQYHVFWASRHYQPSDTSHQGLANLDRIRYATTSDFRTFTAPQDYLALPDTPLIDQEFQYLGQPGHYARFLKNETVNQIYQEVTTDGIFGHWSRIPGYVRPETPTEGPASFADLATPGLYHLWLDNYVEYIAFQTSDILQPVWGPSPARVPLGLKHGCVTPLTQQEYDAIARRWPH